MSSLPRILFIDDEYGTNAQMRRDFCRVRCLRIVAPAEQHEATVDDAKFLADAYFHSGMDDDGLLSIEAVKEAVGEHWREVRESGDWRWALVCVDMSFTAKGRATNFGAEIVCALRADKQLFNIPIALISGMPVGEIEDAVQRAAVRGSYGSDTGPTPPRIAKSGDQNPLLTFAKLLFTSALIEDGSLRKVDNNKNIHVISSVRGKSSTIGSSLPLLRSLQIARESLARNVQFGRYSSLFFFISHEGDEGKYFNIYNQNMWCVAYEYFTKNRLPRRSTNNNDAPNIEWRSTNPDSTDGYYEIPDLEGEDLLKWSALPKKSSAPRVAIASITAVQRENLSRELEQAGAIDLGRWPSIGERGEDLAKYASSLSPEFGDSSSQVSLHDEVDEYIINTIWDHGFLELRKTTELAFENTIVRGGETVRLSDFIDARYLYKRQGKSTTPVNFAELLDVLTQFRFREQSRREDWEVHQAWPKLRDALAPVLLSMFETGAKHERAVKKNGTLNVAGLAKFLEVPGINEPLANANTKMADFATRLADEFGFSSDLIDQLKAGRRKKAQPSPEGETE